MECLCVSSRWNGRIGGSSGGDMRKSSKDTVIEDVEGADGLVFMAQRVFISRTMMMRRWRTISPIIRVLSGDEDRTGEPGVVVYNEAKSVQELVQ